MAADETRVIDGKFSMKYGINSGEIVNTVSGEVIPQDEPLFLLRARDNNAIACLVSYLNICKKRGCNDLHLAGIQQNIEKFTAFAQEHPERMKQPGITKHLKLDTADSAPQQEWIERAAAELCVGPKRCPICLFPLAETADKGCVLGNCSYRSHHETETLRIRRERWTNFCQIIAAHAPRQKPILPQDFPDHLPHAKPGTALKATGRQKGENDAQPGSRT